VAGRFIGVDAGGTMTKAALFDADGVELACCRRPNKMLFPAPGHTERDPEAMWQAACSAIRAVLEESQTDPREVSGISATAYGAGLYLVDRDLDPVRPGIVSTDSRANDLVAGWQKEGVAALCGALSQQRVWAAQSSVLLAWLHRDDPTLLERTHSVLFCKDFLRAKLCGDVSTDPTDAGISGLIDVTTGSYQPELLRLMGIEAWLDRLPPIGKSAEIVGGVSRRAAQETGLRENTPVVRGVVDVVAASLACSMTDPAMMTVVAGTFSINQTLHAVPRTSTPPFLQCAYPLENYYLATEGAATSAGNLEWFCRVMLEAEAARAAEQGRTIYDVCEELLSDAMERDSDTLFFPFLFGGPGGAPAGLVGLTAAASLSDALRAIYEGIVFAHRMDVDALLAGPDAATPTIIRLAGGGSRSMIWPQLFADVLGLPVEVMQCGELGAQGAAIVTAAAVGHYADLGTAARSMPGVARRYEPNLARRDFYERKYQHFTKAAASLGEIWTQYRTAVA
jgi:L-xylulokinase